MDDVSVELRSGKTLCMVGESGSGKSVMASSILQTVEPAPQGRVDAVRRPGGVEALLWMNRASAPLDLRFAPAPLPRRGGI